MANARGKEIDNTDLSIDQAEVRGFIHRDYIAHCLRWTHVAKYLHLKSRYKSANILDIGCGKDMPLARMLMTSRLAPKMYLGFEYNKMDIPSMFDNTKFKPNVISGQDFTKYPPPPPQGAVFNYTVCFEVLEHVEPLTAIEILKKVYLWTQPGTISWWSTPCWDERVGAAKNHVNEMKYEALGSMLEHCGYKIHNHWGTFASIKDYKQELIDCGYGDLFERLRSYYDSNYLATILAPLWPQHARNCIWETEYVGKLTLEERMFPTIDKLEGRLGSSEKWRDMLTCANDQD